MSNHNQTTTTNNNNNGNNNNNSGNGNGNANGNGNRAPKPWDPNRDCIMCGLKHTVWSDCLYRGNNIGFSPYKGERDSTGKLKCLHCGGTDHPAMHCPSPPEKCHWHKSGNKLGGPKFMRAMRDSTSQGNSGNTVTNNVQTYAQSLTKESPNADGEDTDDDLANLNDVINSQVTE